MTFKLFSDQFRAFSGIVMTAYLLLPPNSSPSSFPVRRVKTKVRELATGTARDMSRGEEEEREEDVVGFCLQTEA